MKILKYVLFSIFILAFARSSFAEITAKNIIDNMKAGYAGQSKGIADLIIKTNSHNTDTVIYKKRFLSGKDTFLKTRIETRKGGWQMLYINDGDFLWSIERIFGGVEKRKRKYTDDEFYFLGASCPKLLGTDYLGGNKAYILKVGDIFSAFGTRGKKKWEKDLESVPASIWVDGERWVVLKMELKYTPEKSVFIYYRDYRNIAGKWIPYKTEYYVGDDANKQLFLTEDVTQVKVNTGLDGSLFDACKELDALGVERVYERNPIDGSLSMQWHKRREE